MLIPKSCVTWTQLQRPDADYAGSIEADFKQIEPFLPEEVSSILDIGCGLGGINIYLKKKYPQARLELLDGDGVKAKYGFLKQSAPYNSRKATEEFLAANGVAVDKWHDVGTKEHLKADLIISLLSWGFHYPLDTYRVSGLCIVDIRRNTVGVGERIYRAPKYDRCLVRL